MMRLMKGKKKKPKDQINWNKMTRGDSDNQMQVDDADDIENNPYYENPIKNYNDDPQSNGYNHQTNGANGAHGSHRPRNKSRTKSNDKLYVGDKILLANRKSGKVTSLGPKPEKEGIWVRVVMDSHGQVWDDPSKKNRTIWVPIQRVDKIQSHGHKFDLTIGDRVIERKKKIHGTIKYVGPTHFEKGVWFGVELDSAKGKNNGTVKKKFYFKARENHGVMLPYKRLEPEDASDIDSKRKKNKNKKNARSHSDLEEVRNSTKKSMKNRKKHHVTRSEVLQSSHGNHSNDHIPSQSLHIEDHLNNRRQQQMYNDNNTDKNNGHKARHSANKSSNDDNSYLPSDEEEDTQVFNNASRPALLAPPKAKEKKIPKEKSPLAGFKRLVADDDNEDSTSPPPSPSPYPHEQNSGDSGDDSHGYRHSAVVKTIELDEANLKIMREFRIKMKEFSGLEKELFESELPSITEVNKEQREKIFVEKLRLCKAQCDFFDTSDQMMELIQKKERYLLELSEFIARHVWFKESLYEESLCAVSRNLFRALPYQDRPPALSFFNDEVFDKDTNFEDPAWRHLKLVYDLTWRVINTPQVTAAMMEKHMTGKFLGNLVELFASEDHRERAYLMMILHKIYGRCLKLRPYIISILSGYFYRMIYSDEFVHVNGIIELLQIICAIIPGLTVPVKDSWQSFVRNILVPLHKCRGLKKFWEQLTQCCVNYVAKDEEGGAIILGGLLKFWPQQSPQKEEIFIMEVVNIINVLITHQHGFSYENHKEVLVAAASKLTSCMLSTRQPVAERAIAAWKEQSMQRLVDYDRKAFLPKLCEAFYRNRDHQNVALKQSSTAVEKIYRSKDSAYWKKMQQYLTKKDKKETTIAKQIDDAEKKFKDPYEIVKLKHEKEKERKKRPKPLTSAERRAKRNHFWERMRHDAVENAKEIGIDFVPYEKYSMYKPPIPGVNT